MPEPELVESEESDTVVVRHAPRYGRFLALGAAVGVILALVLTFSFPENDEYSQGQVFGFLLLACVAIAGAAGGLAAILLDRAATKRARSLPAVHETGRRVD
ncbi:hypothetical protein GB864_01730 [Agromyces sp. MMS17-SY077]|uniref:Potassium transporter Trk n=2 Tax=Agromyces seonyuensis TaxID=2662446 RepID=A0A6I4NS82_9MICO|nr:hypothetical protein [Agromyces seonyuensis]